MKKLLKSSWKRKFISFLIVFTFLGSIYVFTPNNASAVMVNITGLAEGYDQGTQIEIIADIYIEDGERIPINDILLEIAGPMYVNTTYNVNGTPISSPSWISITLLSIQGQDPGYGYGYGSYDDYYDSNNGLRYGYDYDDSQTYDFGYGYGYIGRLKYKITIDSSFLLIGNYTMQLHANTGNIIHQRFSSDLYPFSVWSVGESGKSWPQFQNNPAHTGYSTSQAPDYDYLVWERYPSGGSGRTPVISDGKVVLSGDDKIYSFDEETGNLLWQYDAPSQVGPVPAISGDKVFFTTQWYDSTAGIWKGSLRSLNLNNGSLIWTSLTESSSSIRDSSVTVADGRIFVSDSNYLYSVSQSDGNPLWTWLASGNSSTWGVGQEAPLIYQGNVYVRHGDYKLSSIDEITGVTRWTKNINIWSGLSAIDGKIFFGYNYFLISANATNGDTLWTFPTQLGVYYPPALAYGNAYLLNREYNVSLGEWHLVLYSLDQSNGTLNWKYETPWDASFSGSPAVADGKVYFGGGNTGFYSVDAFNGTLLWRSGMAWGSLYTPSIANGKVFVASGNYLYAFGIDKYAPLHSNENPSINGLTSDPTPTISVDVTDQSGVVEGTIRLKVNGISVFYDKSTISDGFMISYTHIGGFSDGENVSVQIIADDIYDNVLDYTWYFIVDLTQPEVLSYTPTGIGISINTNITVEFTEEMDKWSAENAFSISPGVSGNFSWSGNTMTFTPNNPLDYGTTYNSYEYSWARDIAGNDLLMTYSWNFTTEPAPDITPPDHSNEYPTINGFTNNTTPTISVWVTDISGVDQSTIRLYIDGFSVFYDLTPVSNGYNVSYYWDVGFAVGKVVPCRIIADDVYGNRLDFSWSFTVVNATYFELPLSQGWNFISIPLIQTNESLDKVLENITGLYDYVMWYDASDIAQTIAVTNELVFGPAVGGETGPFNLAYTTIKDISLYNDMEGLWILGEDYTFDWTTGTIDISAGATHLNAGESLIAFYNYTKPGDSWKTYATFRPAFMNDLLNIDNTMGFWIRMLNSTTLTVNGTAPLSTDIPLYAGWNLVGYPSLNSTTSIANALAGTGYTKVGGFNATAPYMVENLPDTYLMKPGEGYWVHVPADSIWTIDW